MKNTTIIILLSICTFSACGQTNLDCDEIRVDTPHFTDYKVGKMDSLISLDLEVIGNCIELDSIDKKSLNPQVLAVLMIQLTNENKEINYGNIIDYIDEFISTEQYKKEIDVLQFVERDIAIVMQGRDFEKLSDSEKEVVIEQLHKTWSHPDNEVRNRIKLFAVRSPDVLKPILES
jgi:hypothetical protein